MSKQPLVKVVLSTGKVVFLRQMKISDSEVAAQQVASRANGDVNVLQLLMQKALVQQLLARIAPTEDAEPKVVSGNEREDLDSLFTLAEYSQVLQVVGKISGADNVGKEPRIEILAELA